MKEIGIGLLGFGTVGAGVVEGLQNNADLMAQRLGVRPVLRRIADLDVTSDRGVEVAPELLTTDARAVIDDPSVDLVIELIGGVGIAKDLILESLASGKPVVTANKALLAEDGADLFAMAAETQTDLYYEAAVGGGIPIIRALREGLASNEVTGIVGILNGTCNYILTRMENEGLPFDQVLAEAQAAGYAEADPGLDVDGFDTAHKAVILAALAAGGPVPMSAIDVEGVRGLAGADVEYAHDLGYRIKMLSVIKLARTDGGREVEVRVHPALVPLPSMLASVSGVYNAVMVCGDMAGQTLYYGRGAGREPTASAVLGDVADVCRNLARGTSYRVPSMFSLSGETTVKPIGDTVTRHYLRMSLLDRPGVLAHITQVLGEAGISIASALQKGVPVDEYVPVILLTHEARECDLVDAIETIDALDIVGAPTVRLRIEE